MEPTRSSTDQTSKNLTLPGINCRFLGSLTSARGRELLSQVCLQIAQQSKLQHHFVDRRDIEKINRDLLQESIFKSCPLSPSNSTEDHPHPFEMKVFYVRDHLEPVSKEQVNYIIY